MSELPSDLLSLTPVLVLELGMTVFCIIIIRQLLMLYYRTSLLDYLIFAGIFSSFVGYANPITHLLCYSNILVVWQLRHTFLNLTYLFMFLHSLRVLWEKFPTLLTIFGFGWFLVLELLILFWIPMARERVLVLLWEMEPHSLSPPVSSAFGAGITLNDIVVYSTGHPLLAYGYYMFCALIFSYSYFFVKPINPTTRIIAATRIWRAASVINITAIALLIIWPISDTFLIAAALVFIELFLVGIVVALKYPESMIISYVQLHRALNLYEAIQKASKSEQPQMESLAEYLRSIPQNILHPDN